VNNMSTKKYAGLEADIPTNPTDVYRDICKKIDEILNFKDALRASFGNSVDMIENSYRIMKEHIERAIKDVPVKATEGEINSVQRSIDFLINHNIHQPITPIYKDITVLLIQLFRNWNNNCIKNPRIEEKILYLERLYTSCFTTREAIEVLKALIIEGKRVLQYEPPAFKLSKAYLGVLEATINDKKES